MRHGLLKEVGQETAIFRQPLQICDTILTHSCKFPTAEIMGAQNINFARKCC